MILKFRIDRQKITRLDDSFVVARSKNYLYAEFEFTDDWTGDIFAIFKNSNIIKPYSQKLVDNKCIVPWEVLQMPGTLTVSAFGGDLITANNVAVKIHDTGYDENAAESMTPTPEVYQQVIQEMIEKVSENEDVKANTASRHSHDNKSVIDTITKDMIKKWNAKENASNKTKVIDSNSTDEEYPSAKAVFNHTADVSSNIMQEVYNHHESAMQSIGEEATYRATAVQQLENDKADKSTTLDGYGITDAYTKSEVDTMLGDFETLITELHTYAQNKVNGGATS